MAKEVFEGVGGKNLLASRIRAATVARTQRQRGHPLNTGSNCFER
jgi:hypothetical protein